MGWGRVWGTGLTQASLDASKACLTTTSSLTQATRPIREARTIHWHAAFPFTRHHGLALEHPPLLRRVVIACRGGPTDLRLGSRPEADAFGRAAAADAFALVAPLATAPAAAQPLPLGPHRGGAATGRAGRNWAGRPGWVGFPRALARQPLAPDMKTRWPDTGHAICQTATIT